MMDWMYSIGFKISQMGQVSAAEKAVDALDSSVDRVNGSADRAGGSLARMGQRGQSGFQRLAGAARSYLATAGLVLGVMTSINTAAQFDAQNIAIDFSTGGVGTESVLFIKNLSDELGVSLTAAREGYKQLAAATMNTPLSGQATNDIFEGVATAGAAMRLTEDNMKGVFLALGQIQSKGKVMAEELRGQLGERLPGSFGIAADAMGVTQSELNKLLETGQVTSNEFLPKFAAQLQREFGPLATEVADSPAAAMERFKNSVFDLQVAFGTQLLPVVNTFLTNYLIPSINFIGEHIGLFTTLAATMGGVFLAVQAYSAATAIATTATAIWTAGQWLLNAAFIANPIGLVITAIGALVGGVLYAWNKFEGFRSVVTGMWEVFKTFGQILWEYTIEPLMSMGKVLIGVFTFDKDLIMEGISDGMASAEKLITQSGPRLIAAWQKGTEAGRVGFNLDKAGIDETGATMGGRNRLFNSLDRQQAASAAGGGIPTTGSGSGRAGISGITGRSQSKNITINLGSLVQELTLQTATAEGGTDEMQDMVMRKLVQAINMANQVQ